MFWKFLVPFLALFLACKSRHFEDQRSDSLNVGSPQEEPVPNSEDSVDGSNDTDETEQDGTEGDVDLCPTELVGNPADLDTMVEIQIPRDSPS